MLEGYTQTVGFGVSEGNCISAPVCHHCIAYIGVVVVNRGQSKIRTRRQFTWPCYLVSLYVLPTSLRTKRSTVILMPSSPFLLKRDVI